MKNILVLTDFSQNAKSAEQYALQLAIKARANIFLYNAYPMHTAPLSNAVVWPHNAPLSPEMQSLSNLQAGVDALKDELKKTGDTFYTPEITHLGDAGSLPDLVNNVIAKHKIWLVIMGTKGEGFANTLVFGSNVFKVLDHINCPLLIVPENAELNALRSIAYATDLRNTDMDIVAWLKDMAEILSTGLSILHVSKDPASALEDASKKITGDIVHSKTHDRTEIKYVQGKNLVDALHEVVQQMNVDILALMHRKYGFFDSLFHPSTSYQMIKKTKMPILVFPG